MREVGWGIIDSALTEKVFGATKVSDFGVPTERYEKGIQHAVAFCLFLLFLTEELAGARVLAEEKTIAEKNLDQVGPGDGIQTGTAVVLADMGLEQTRRRAC